MFNLNDIIQSAQGGNAVGNIAQQFGISPDQAQAAVQALIPAISAGLLQKASSGGLGSIAAALGDPDHLAAFSSPGAAQSDDTVQKGSDVVDNLFGSSHITQQIAQQASAITGLRPDVLVQMLPVVVSIVVGGLAKSAQNQGLGGMIGQLASGAQQGGAQSGGILGMLMGLLGGLFGNRPNFGIDGPRRLRQPHQDVPARQPAAGGQPIRHQRRDRQDSGQQQVVMARQSMFRKS